MTDLQDLREAEDTEIRSRYQSELDLRGHRVPLSPSFLATQPRTILEKLSISAEDEETVLHLYAGTYSLHKTALSSGLPLEKVRAIVYSPTSSERIQAYRDQLKVSVIQKIEETQIVLLDEIQSPDKLKDASLTQISEVFTEISGVQSNLVSSLGDSSTASIIAQPESYFSGEDLEYIALLRRRLDVGSHGSHDPSPLDERPWETPLDFIDTTGTPGSSTMIDVGDDSTPLPEDDPPSDLWPEDQ